MSSTPEVPPTVDEIQPEQRMRTYISFLSKRTWVSVRDELNERRKDTNMAQMMNDMRQRFRIPALEQLAQKHISIDKDWEQLQRDRFRNDPDEVFPLVATRWLLESLPDSMTKCNVCGDDFIRGEDIIKTACGKHSLHLFCLTAQLNEGEVPLYGPCDCDSDEMSPLVATQRLLGILPNSRTKCNVCGDDFVPGDDIINKACGKHLLHRLCLTARLNKSEVPLYGPCGCNDGGYGSELWRLVVDQAERLTPQPVSRLPRPIRRPATPIPWSYELKASSPYTSSQDSDFSWSSESDSDTESACSCSSSFASTAGSNSISP